MAITAAPSGRSTPGSAGARYADWERTTRRRPCGPACWRHSSDSVSGPSSTRSRTRGRVRYRLPTASRPGAWALPGPSSTAGTGGLPRPSVGYTSVEGEEMAEISLEHVTKRFPDGYEAVRDMNLEVEDGEFMILVGPSGCGKSTALRMVAGLEEITDGDLRIGGETVNALPPKERDVAMVFQNYALYPHMSVRDNMGFALKLRGVEGKEIDKKVSEAARVLDLEEHLDRKPSQLSGGQRQRVAMGRAIVRDPAAFLMDEPLSNLDAKLRVQMRAEVSRIQQRLGTTTIYVTHDQTEALTLGDRVAVMRSGVVQQVGQPMELYNEPANLFVA